MEPKIEEIWKDVVGYEGYYQVSSLGQVRRIRSMMRHWRGGMATVKECILKPGKDKDGYHHVSLRCTLIGKVSNTIKVHRLVLSHFIENIENKPQVNHINGIKSDNRLINLEWSSSKDNIIHAYKNGLSKSRQTGEMCNFSKLKKEDVLKIRLMHKKGSTVASIAREIGGITASNVSCITRYKTWRSVK